MRLTIASDLHADFGHDNNIQWPEADVLILAGDTANNIGTLTKVMKRAAKSHAGPIVVVDGNHEHYSNRGQDRTLAETRAKIKAQLPENAVFLDIGAPYFVHDGVAFIGCNAWYGSEEFHEDFWKGYMNDYRNAFSCDVVHPAELALASSKHIDAQIEDALSKELKVVVVTHTAPSMHCCQQKPWDLSWQKANEFYYNSFNEKLLSKYGSKIALWVHGHVHNRKELTLDEVRIVANPRGYPHELPKWEPLVVEV